MIGLNASLPEKVRPAATELFQKYIPGDVPSYLAEHTVFTGGKVTITGVELTETQRDDLTQASKEKLFSRDLHNKTASPNAVNMTVFRRAA